VTAVLYCGDPHGEFRHILKAAAKMPAAPIVLLGDLEPARPLHAELESVRDRVWYIHGNHDTDSDGSWIRLWEDNDLIDRNIDGRVVKLSNGIRLAGLGGVFRGEVWHPELNVEPLFRNRHAHTRATPRQDRWREGVHRKHWSTIYPDELDAMADLRADVLVTHEAPSYHRHGFEILDTLAQCMGVKVTVHGHHHDRLDSSDRWDQQGFRSFGVGLCGITAIDAVGNAEVIVPGRLDAQRDHRQMYLDLFKDAAS